MGYLFGLFLGGALIGSVSMIIMFVKKRWGLGIAAPVVCGCCAIWNVIATWIAGIIYLIIAIITKSERNQESYYVAQPKKTQKNTSQNKSVSQRPNAAIPTNPGTDKIPAWKRVELEKKAAAAAHEEEQK